MKNSATISGDIISFTALSNVDKNNLINEINEFLAYLHDKYLAENFFGRVVKGDFIEIALKNPKSILRIALMIKTLIKSFKLDNSKSDDNRIKYFEEYGIRLAVAVAPLERLNPERGIIDGKAIYFSGRKLKNMGTYDKNKIIIKRSMFFCSSNKEQEDKFEVIFTLLDEITRKCSAKQCEVLNQKLKGLTEIEISGLLGKSQSTINQHSNAAGWNAIEKAVSYFEKNI